MSRPSRTPCLGALCVALAFAPVLRAQQIQQNVTIGSGTHTYASPIIMPNVVFSITGGTVNANQFNLYGGNARLNVSGGTLSLADKIYIVSHPGGGQTARVIQSGGSITTAGVNFTNDFNYNESYLTQSAGSFVTGPVKMFADHSGVAQLDAGGDFTASDIECIGGSNSFPRCQINVPNGGRLTTSRLLFRSNRQFAGWGGLAFDGGTLRAGPTDNPDWVAVSQIFTWDPGFNAGANGVRIDTNGRSMGIRVPVTGPGGLAKIGAGTLTLGTRNTYSGVTSVEQGTLETSGTSPFAGGGTLRLRGGTLRVTGAGTTSANADAGQFNGTIDIADAARTLTLNQSTGAGLVTPFTKTGAGTLVFTGQNSWIGGTTVSGGTLRLAGAATDGVGTLRGPITVTNATLEATRVDALGYAAGSRVTSIILTNASLVHDAPGNNGWGVNYSLNASTMRSNGGAADPTAASKFAFGADTRVQALGTEPSSIHGRIDLRGDSPSPTSAFVVDSPLLDVYAAITSTHGVQPGVAGFVKAGNGTLVLHAIGTHRGISYLQSGELVVAHPEALRDSTVQLDGGALRFREITEPVFGALSGTVSLPLQNTDEQPVWLSAGGNGGSGSYAGALSGPGGFAKRGAGTMTLEAVNPYEGGTRVQAGRLRLARAPAPNGLGVVRGTVQVDAGATLETASVDALGWIDGAKVDRIVLNGAALDHSAAGNNGWGIAYELDGATLRSNGAVASTSAASSFSFGGPPEANTSVMVTGSTASTIAGRIDLRADNGHTESVFDVHGGANLDVPAGISGGGSAPSALVKRGVGTMTLGFANNSYAGATRIEDGLLRVTGSTGSGAVTVSPNTTLGGNGRVTGAAQAFGVIAPGAPLGTLTFTHGLALHAGARLALELGSTRDLVRVSGGTFAAPTSGQVAIDIAAVAGFTQGSYVLVDFAGASPGSVDLTDFALGATPGASYSYTLRLQGTSLILDVGQVPTAPTITSVALPPNDLYARGETLDFVVNFSEPVNTTNGVRIPITLDSGSTQAGYISGTGTNALRFRYGVGDGQRDADGIVLATALDRQGGTIADAAGNAAVLTLNGVPSTAGIRVDGVLPTVQSMALVGTPPSNSTSLQYTVRFSEAITGLDRGDFTVTTDEGNASANVAAISGSGDEYVATLSGVGGVGKFRLELRALGTGIVDAAANAMQQAASAQEFIADRSVRCHVNASAIGANDGSAWADAYVDLQSAVRDFGCNEIWVARGVYIPGAVPADTFALRASVVLRGGFAGDETSIAQRTLDDIAANRTVLSGDLGRDDATDGEGIVADANGIVGTNSLNVISLFGTSSRPIAWDTLIEGIAITGGSATTGSFRYGGGIRCEAALAGSMCSPTITDVLFSGNRAVSGAGMALSATSGSTEPHLLRVTFRGNRAQSSGGGLSASAGNAGARAAPLVRNATFVDNHAVIEAAAIAGHSGGGEVAMLIQSVSFTGNTSPGRGGALSLAGYQGGTARASVVGSVMWGNSAPEVYNQFDGIAEIASSVVQGGCPLGNTCNALVDGDPRFGPLEYRGGAVPVLFPGTGSAAVDLPNGGAPEDARGSERPQGMGFDAGAVEVRQSRLWIDVVGLGSVSAVATPAPQRGAIVNCDFHSGENCIAYYRTEPELPQITLITMPAPGWHVASWSGDCDDATVTLDRDRRCTLTFAENMATVALTREGSGTPTYGDDVVLAATVSAVPAATVQPTGEVAFFDGANLLGTATLDAAGRARLATRALPAGSRSLTAHYGGDAEYPAPPGSSVLALEIAPATLRYVATPATFVYGDTIIGLGGEVTGFVNGETVASVTRGTLAFSSTAAAGSPAGNYPIDGAGLEADNYRFEQAPGNAQALTIEKAQQVLVFGAAPQVVVGGTGIVIASGSGTKAGTPILYSTASSACAVNASSGEVTGVAVGTDNCTIRATRAGDANHLAAEASLSFGIGRGTGQVVFGELSFVYDGSPQMVTAHLAQQPTLACVVTNAQIGPDVGDYAVEAQCEGTDYVASAEATATIRKAVGNVVFDTLQFVYDGETHVVSAHIDEEPTSTCVVAASPIGPDAGDYAVAAVCNGDNYTANGDATATIARAVGTVAFEALQFTYDGDTHAVTAHIVEEPASACVVAASPIGPAAGDYAVAAVCDGDNYTANGNGTATIARAIGTVAFDALQFTYDGDTQLVSAHIAEEPESACVVSASPIGPAAGDYAVTAVCEGDDYTATGSATATIARAPQQLEFPAQGVASRGFVSGATFVIDPLATGVGAHAAAPIRYATGASAICEVTGTEVTMRSAGTCVIKADRDGDANFLDAPTVQVQVMLTAPDTADLQIAVGADRATALAGDTVMWTIVATNLGAADVSDARIAAMPSTQLVGMVWECKSNSGCPDPAFGDGAIDATVDLEAGAELRFEVFGDVASGTAEGTWVDVPASIALPTGSPLVDPVSGNDADTERVQIVLPAVFRDGFEAPRPRSP